MALSRKLAGNILFQQFIFNEANGAVATGRYSAGIMIPVGAQVITFSIGSTNANTDVAPLIAVGTETSPNLIIAGIATPWAANTAISASFQYCIINDMRITVTISAAPMTNGTFFCGIEYFLPR